MKNAYTTGFVPSLRFASTGYQSPFTIQITSATIYTIDASPLFIHHVRISELSARKEFSMIILRLFPFVLLVTLSACAPVDPVGGGQIRWRCDPNADAGNSTICAPGQYPLCVIGADAGNGRSPGLCCDSTETESSCLQRSGLVPADAGRTSAGDR